MKKILIAGSSDTVMKQMEKHIDECGKLKKVTIFFNQYNFLITSYDLMSTWVHMILEFENREVQIESANCGYSGAGPNAAVDVLELCGLKRKQIEPIILGNTALSFSVTDGKMHNIGTEQRFYDVSSPVCYTDMELKNQIQQNENVDIKLSEKKVRLYNPQRTNWIGFMNLLNYMKDIQMEYYIGNNSPLDGGLRVDERFQNKFTRTSEIDTKGTTQVNLFLHGSNFSISCCIDREYEVEVIEAVYLALTGQKLKLPDNKQSLKERIKSFTNREKKKEIYGSITIKDI